MFQMDVLEAMKIVRNCPDDQKKDASALLVCMAWADGDFSDMEFGAFWVIDRCTQIPFFSYDEAKAHLGF